MSIQQQNDFTHGQIDFTMEGRTNLSIYNKALRRAENVLVNPQGPIGRRFGTKLIDPFNDIDIGSGEYSTAEFELEDEFYLLVFLSDRLLIYQNDSILQTIVAADGYPYNASSVERLDTTQNNNQMVICDRLGNLPPYEVYYDFSASEFVIGQIAFSHVPPFDFNTYDYSALTFTLSTATVGKTATLTSTGNIFVDAHEGGIFSSLGNTSINSDIGIAQIVSVNSATECTVDIISAFDPSHLTGILGSNVKLAEKAWSDVEADGTGDRGWPTSCTFFQGRLWFGGSKGVPDQVVGSQVGKYQNCGLFAGFPDDPIIEQGSSNKFNKIRYILGDKTIKIFTNRAEWAFSTSEGPITPSTAAIQSFGSQGSTSLKPILFDNVVFYVKRGGKSVNAFYYDFNNQTYKSTNVSRLSSEVIRNPVSGDVLQGSTEKDTDYLFLVNEDGTLAIYQSVLDQNVSAWTISNTINRTADSKNNALFKRVQVIDNNVYFIVERVIDGQTRTYLEKLDFDLYTDCTIERFFGVKVTTINGLFSLEGMKVQIRASNNANGPWVVVSDTTTHPNDDNIVTNGELDISEDIPIGPEGFRYFQVGLKIDPLIEILPVVLNTQNGTTMYTPIAVNKVFVQYYESLGILVNGVEIPNLEFGDQFSPVDQSLTPSGDPQSGIDEIYREGQDVITTITITQEQPLPMTILSIGYEVS